jgi:FlaA1/EpsC-like NDP-sugar epimerase
MEQTSSIGSFFMLLDRLSPWLRRILAYSHDMIVTALSFPIAYILRVGLDELPEWQVFALPMALMLIIAVLVYPTVGLNRGAWRYASLKDITAIVLGATIVIASSVLVIFLASRLENVPRSVPVINWLILIVGLGGPRLLYRIVRDASLGRWPSSSKYYERCNVVLFGFSDEADVFIRSMQRNRKSQYRVLAIFDQKAKHRGRHLHGVPVIGAIDTLNDFCIRMRARDIPVERLVIARTKMSEALLNQLVSHAAEAKLAVDQLPDWNRVGEAGGPGDELPVPQALKLEDLLGRDPVQLDTAIIARMLAGRKVFVTGAGGSIGSELSAAILKYNPARLVLTDNCEYNLYALEQDMQEKARSSNLRYVFCDVRDAEQVKALMEEEEPEIVFHAAALKHVPIVEDNPIEGVKTNIFGTRNVANAALNVGAEAFVMISTDKAVNPTNVMGTTKRVAEAYCQSRDLEGTSTRFMTVRFGNVLGSRGSVVPLFEKQLKAGGPITVTHPDIKRYFMTISEAVQLVLQASAHGLERSNSRGKIFVLDMGKLIKIVDLAKRMIQLAGLRPDKDIQIIYTGLRPGEKLYEELLDNEESLEQTGSDRIFVASPRTVNIALLEKSLEELMNAAQNSSASKVLLLLRHIVPEFRLAVKEQKNSDIIKLQQITKKPS